MKTQQRSGFATEDEGLAWTCWADEASVDLVAPKPGCVTFQQLLWRRTYVHPRRPMERLNMVEGGDLSHLLRRPPPMIGSPSDLYAACKSGRITAWGRFREGKLEPIPVAEWAEGIPPKGWTDRHYDWDQLYRAIVINKTDPVASGAHRQEEKLLRANKVQIRSAISAVYDTAQKRGEKPPNIKQLVKPVQEELRTTQREASGKQIIEIGGEEEFVARRRPPGKTIASEKYIGLLG